MITFVTEQEELYESRGSRTVLWEGLSEILEPDPIMRHTIELHKP